VNVATSSKERLGLIAVFGAAFIRQIRCNFKLLDGHIGEVRKGVANATLVNDPSQGHADNVGIEKRSCLQSLL
jgi:hypothetical protein